MNVPLTAALPLIFALVVLALSAFATDRYERRRGWRHVGPASDHGPYGLHLNDKSPAALDGHRALSSNRYEKG